MPTRRMGRARPSCPGGSNVCALCGQTAAQKTVKGLIFVLEPWEGPGFRGLPCLDCSLPRNATRACEDYLIRMLDGVGAGGAETRLTAAVVAQLVELSVVVRAVVGSSPIHRPIPPYSIRRAKAPLTGRLFAVRVSRYAVGLARQSGWSSLPPIGTFPVTFDHIRARALAWPGVEDGTSYGTPALKVRGKFLTRLREDGDTLVVTGVDGDERDLLMAMDPTVYFITDHYVGWPTVLARLSAIPDVVGLDRVVALLHRRWRAVASKGLVRQFDAGASA
jgi:hypothetical protein